MITNISGYRFISLSNLPELKMNLFEQCHSLNLKGTILLSEEGININLAGHADNILEFQKYLLQIPNLADIAFRNSKSEFFPFKRLKVQIKKEIITWRVNNNRPESQHAPHISPQELKQWLDEKRDINLIDTRNKYEVAFGTFKNAINPDINEFSEFANFSINLDKDKPVVMFCTGGIRCEKAALHLLQHGFSQVFQLQHGILNYFKEVGNAHYEGECFVFDERIALDASLTPTGTQQCVTCQKPVKPNLQHHCE